MAVCPVDVEKLGLQFSSAGKSRFSRRCDVARKRTCAAHLCRRGCQLAAYTVIALSLLMLAPAQALGAAIYKCLDNHLGLVYTDVPCKDGEKLDIRLGDVDLAAVAKLERLRDQLDQSAAQRISDERRAAAQLVYAQQLRREREERSATEQYVSAYDGYLGYGYGAYPPFDGRHLPRERLHNRERARGFAPSPPYIVPRP